MLVAVGTRSIAPGRESEWEDIWARMHALAAGQPGFRSARLMKSTEHLSKYTLLAEWDDAASWDRFYEHPEMQELTQRSFMLLKSAPVQEWHEVLHEVVAEGSPAR